MNERNKKIDLNSAKLDEEKKSSLRPLSLNEFIGQQFIKSNLEAYIESVSYTHLTLPTIQPV